MRTALVAVVIAAMAVTSAGLWQMPTYEASAQVWVSWQQEEQWANSGGSGEQIQTLEYRELPPTQEIMHTIGTHSVAQEVIQRLELQMDPDELSDNLTVEQVENTSFIVFTYEDTDPERARVIVNTVSEVFSEFISERSSRSLTAKVYEEAAVPVSSVSPHPLRNGLLTLVIGLMLCAGGFVATPSVRARVAGGERIPRRDHSIVERIKEKKLLRAIGRRGKLTAVEAALETSLSVEEANRMLFDLAARGHLEVTVEHSRLLYSFWEHGA